MLSSEHHITLEEIGRLEAERNLLNTKIAKLRQTLPKAEVIVQRPTENKSITAPLRDVPVRVLVAPEPKVLEPEISDHAIIRYLERLYNFSFDQMKAELLSSTLRLGIKIGAQSVKAHGGRFMIRGNKATTFIADSQKSGFRHKGKRS